MRQEARERIVSAVETGLVLLAFVPLWLWMFLWRGRRDWILYGTLAVLVTVAVRRIRRFVALGRRPPAEGGP